MKSKPKANPVKNYIAMLQENERKLDEIAAKRAAERRKLDCFDTILAACRAALDELNASIDVDAPSMAREMCIQAIMRYDDKPPTK